MKFICTKCNKEKDKDEFVKDSKRKHGIRLTCKQCHRNHAKLKRIEFRKNNPTKYELHRQMVLNRTEKPCNECGIVKPLDTDHYYHEKKNLDGFMNHCIECHKIKRNGAYNEKQKSARRKYYQNKQRQRQIDNKLYYINLLGGKCQSCGVTPNNK